MTKQTAARRDFLFTKFSKKIKMQEQLMVGELDRVLMKNHSLILVLVGVSLLGWHPNNLFAAASSPGNGGLILCYPFNGNANDESGNGRHGTVSGATLTTDRFGKSDKAYKTKEGATGITSPFTFKSGETPRTAMLWFKPEKWMDAAPGYYKNHAGSGKVDLLYGFNAALSVWNNGTAGLDGPYRNAVFTGQPIELNQWHHIALTYSGRIDSIKVWIDGKPLTAQTDGMLNYGGSQPLKNTPSEVKLPGTPASFDELRIYDRALSGTEVLQLYNQQKASSAHDCSQGSQSPGTDPERTGPNLIIPPRPTTPGPFLVAPTPYWRTNIAPIRTRIIHLPRNPKSRRRVTRNPGHEHNDSPRSLTGEPDGQTSGVEEVPASEPNLSPAIGRPSD